MLNPSKNFVLTLLLGFVWSVHGAPVKNDYHFTGAEVYPIDDSISLLHAADLTGDGLDDLIVADHLHCPIALLYNQTGKAQLPFWHNKKLIGRTNETSNAKRQQFATLWSWLKLASVLQRQRPLQWVS